MTTRSRVTTGLGLDSDDVFSGLVDHGLFAEKLPPCFSSEGLSSHAPASLAKIVTEKNPQKLDSLLKKIRYCGYVRYQAVREINIPRHLGIPHPYAYIAQCYAIKKVWDKIKAHCAKPSSPISRIFVRYTGKNRVFAMNYKGAERFEIEEQELEFLTGMNYVVHADISTCFPSIYTHSLSWALHTKRKAKKERNDLSLAGNLLDKVTQGIKDGQTNGLLIGPHSSNILAEIVLTCVDSLLVKGGYQRVTRHIDDYRFYARTHKDAESFVRDLGLALRDFELSLNEKKTKIIRLPQPLSEHWVRELQEFKFPAGVIRHSNIRSFLDLALHLCQQSGSSAPLNYAIKMIPGRLNDRAKRLFVTEAINLALSYPYLAPLMDEHVFDKHFHPGIDAAIATFINELIDIGIERIYPDSIAHALYLAVKRNVTLDKTEAALREVIRIDDCIADVLLLEYAKRLGLKKIRSAIIKRANNLKGLDAREQDPFWPLLYEVWSAADLKGNNHAFLGDLKATGFSFLRF